MPAKWCFKTSYDKAWRIDTIVSKNIRSEGQHIPTDSYGIPIVPIYAVLSIFHSEALWKMLFQIYSVISFSRNVFYLPLVRYCVQWVHRKLKVLRTPLRGIIIYEGFARLPCLCVFWYDFEGCVFKVCEVTLVYLEIQYEHTCVIFTVTFYEIVSGCSCSALIYVWAIMCPNFWFFLIICYSIVIEGTFITYTCNVGLFSPVVSIGRGLQFF